MNPLTNVRNTEKLNERELELGLTGTNQSWHNEFVGSAYVFVGGLNFDLTEGDIITVFSQFGEIVDINLVRDKSTGESKGYAFIAYEDQRSTDMAVDNFNGAKVTGRIMRVNHVKDYRPVKDDDGGLVDTTCAPEAVLPDSLKLKPAQKKGGDTSSDESDSSDAGAAVRVKEEPRTSLDRTTDESADHRRHTSAAVAADRPSTSSKHDRRGDERRRGERDVRESHSVKSEFHDPSDRHASLDKDNRRRNVDDGRQRNRSRSPEQQRKQQQQHRKRDRSRSRSPEQRQQRDRHRSPAGRRRERERRSRSRSPRGRARERDGRPRSRSPPRHRRSSPDDRHFKGGEHGRQRERSRSRDRSRSPRPRRRSRSGDRRDR